MAHENSPGKKTKDEKRNSSKGRCINGRGPSTPGSAAADTSGLRRSSRETPSKKQLIASPSSTRKSERLEKQIPEALSVKKKSEKVEKQRVLSPFRRSERVKKQQSSSSSGSKKSDKSSGPSKKKLEEKKLKCSRQLMLEGTEVNRSEGQDRNIVQMKRRMDARSYRALFRQQPKKALGTDSSNEFEETDKLLQRGKSNDGSSDPKQADGRDHECKEIYGQEPRNGNQSCEGLLEEPNFISKNSEKLARGQSENGKCIELARQKDASESKNGDAFQVSRRDQNDFPSSHVVTSKETIADTKMVEASCSDLDKLQTGSPIGQIEHDVDEKFMSLKRKRDIVEVESESCTFVASKDKDTLLVDATDLSQDLCNRMNVSETHDACFGRHRAEPEGAVTIDGSGESNKEQGTESAGNILPVSEQNTCSMCELGGELLSCDGNGCNKSFHLSCTNPTLEEFPPGVWHCSSCVKKKVDCGVHSVSKGVESIWDAREVEVPCNEGLQKQKQYFVKYKGLAHVHNMWVSESQLLHEAPSLIAKFLDKNKVKKWKQEWTMPRLLLKRRMLVFPENCGHAGVTSDCHYEWLVKWCGLDYEHATWELDNASFLCSPEGYKLRTEYENRREKAKRSSVFSGVDKEKRGAFVKLLKLPISRQPGNDGNILYAVNKLHEFWHKGRSAIVFDDQERIIKMISFVLSLQPDVYRPFLIVSTSATLSVWENELLQLAPSLNVVVYTGNRDVRRSIRALEFYEEGGCVMFHVLLSSPEAIAEDMDALKCLGWEVVIMDECQHGKISSCLENIKMLVTGFRLLLVCGQVKDSVEEYLNLLSVLECEGDTGCNIDPKICATEPISKLKSRLSRYIAYACKIDYPFFEYWVPAHVSCVQLEQYCATLLSSAASLRSNSRTDLVGALSFLLTTLRKCCDHPFLVDPSLQTFLIKDLQETEYLDVGIKASGKLQLLDKMLSKVRNCSLRVIILFQPICGAGKVSIGDYLDDFLRQRYGPDSYERVDSGILPSKKQAALNMFNNRESGRFVFLLESRACSSSIKLSSVDAIIIFGSDINPINDFRSLQKITVDSPSEHLKIFRLYSSYTCEEKTLILAKQDTIRESHLHNVNVNRNMNQMLLMWGASYLFDKLDEFHTGSSHAPDLHRLSEQPHLEDAVCEFLSILSPDDENNNSKNSIISKVRHNGGAYTGVSSLAGEQNAQTIGEEQPHVFWTKLLEKRNPRWKLLPTPFQRNRKRAQYSDSLVKKSEVDSDDRVKKRKKLANDSSDVSSSKSRSTLGFVADTSAMPEKVASPTAINGTVCTLKTNQTSPVPPLTGDTSVAPGSPPVDSEERRKSFDAQKDLHLLLEPQISELCEMLQLPVDAKNVVASLLQYVINNYHVKRDSATILEAFQLSLCWCAASWLKHPINHKESVELARQNLSFSCKEKEVDYVYSKLRLLKNSILVTKDGREEFINSTVSGSSELNQRAVKVEIEDGSPGKECPGEGASPPALEVAEKEYLKIRKQIKKRFRKQMKSLILKQEHELKVFSRNCEEEKAQIENEYHVELAIIRSIHGHNTLRAEKLKELEEKFSKQLEEHKSHCDMHLNDLRQRQQDARDKENERKTRTLREIQSWAEELLSKLPLDEAVRKLELLQASDGNGDVFEFLKLAPVTINYPEQSIEKDMHGIPQSDQFHRENASSRLEASGVNAESVSPQPPLIGSDGIIPAKDGGFPLNQAPNINREGNTLENEIENTRLRAGVQSDPARLDQSGHEEPAMQSVMQSQPSLCIDLPPGIESRCEVDLPPCPHNEPVLPLNNQNAHQPRREGEPSLGNQLDQPSNSASSSSQSNYEAPVTEPLLRSDAPHVHNQPNLPSTSFSENQHGILGHAPSQNLEVPALHEMPIQTSNQPISHSSAPADMNSPLGSPLGRVEFHLSDMAPVSDMSDSSNRPTQAAPHQMHAADPLQNELEKIRKEREQIVKIHEDVKLRIRSDCEKEIEEIASQIRKKYDAKLQEVEAAFMPKKKDLEMKHNKVLMNKILAEAFRSKCMDMKVSGTPGGKQDVPLQQLVPRSLQQSVQRPTHSPPPRQQITSQSRPFGSPMRPASSSFPPGQTPFSPLQVVQDSSALFAGTATRPPQISNITPSSGHAQLGSEIRAPAPHLQPFRVPSSFPSLRPSAPPSLHANQPPFPAASISALELLMDVNSRAGINPPEMAAPLPDISSSFDMLDLSDFGNSQINHPARTEGMASEVVCLSDDD